MKILSLSAFACIASAAGCKAPSTTGQPGATPSASIEPHAAPSAPASASASAARPATTARDGFEHLRSLACARSQAAFFKLIDGDRIVVQLLKASPELAYGVMKKAYDSQIQDEWEKDIDRGDKGFICAWKIDRVEGDVVTFKLVSGRTSVAKMERRGDDWVVVGFETKD